MYITFHSVRGENQSGVTPECARLSQKCIKEWGIP